MKPYTVQIDINLPRDRVLEIFDNAENLKHWQTGLQSFEHVSGDPGQPGAKSLLIYQNGRHRIELTETIMEKRLPDEFSGIYEWKGGSNTLRNCFVELEPNKTRWESTCTYKFKSVPMKLMGLLMPGKFKEQNMQFLRNFKAFAEGGDSVQS